MRKELQDAYDTLRKNQLRLKLNIKELAHILSYHKVSHKEFHAKVKTSVSKKKILELSEKMTTLPESFTLTQNQKAYRKP